MAEDSRKEANLSICVVSKNHAEGIKGARSIPMWELVWFVPSAARAWAALFCCVTSSTRDIISSDNACSRAHATRGNSVCARTQSLVMHRERTERVSMRSDGLRWNSISTNSVVKQYKFLRIFWTHYDQMVPSHILDLYRQGTSPYLIFEFFILLSFV